MDLIALGTSLAKIIICDDAFEAEPVAIEMSAVDRAMISLIPSPGSLGSVDSVMGDAYFNGKCMDGRWVIARHQRDLFPVSTEIR